MVHGDVRGDIPSSVSSHAVGDDEQVWSRISAVLIRSADAAHVRTSSADTHEAALISNVVAPIVND
jgi:hypothetical protein